MYVAGSVDRENTVYPSFHPYLIMGEKLRAHTPLLMRLHMNNMTMEAILNVSYTSMEAVQALDRIITNVHILLADGCKNNLEVIYLVL
jgi:hypothetical protein